MAKMDADGEASEGSDDENEKGMFKKVGKTQADEERQIKQEFKKEANKTDDDDFLTVKKNQEDSDEDNEP